MTKPSTRSTTSSSSNAASSSQKASFASIGDLFDQFQLDDKGGYITVEFQDFGMRLAHELGDLKHKSLYIKMAKTIDRSILERALSFVSDSQARSRPKLFMWKVKQLQAASAGKTAA